MSHEITKTDATFSVREMPWMGLLDGQVHVLPDNPTREEAQRLVHPWEPITEPVYRATPVIHEDGTLETAYEVISGSQAVVRSDNNHVLGVTADTTGLITNSELWDVAEAVGKIGTDVVIETGGSLRGGQDVWALLKFANPFMVAGDPNGMTVSFLALQNNHVSKGSFRAQAINTRIVCANTSAAADVEAKRNGFEFRFPHTSKVSERLDEAKAAVAMWREGTTMWQNAMEHLNTIVVTSAQTEEFVQRFQPMPPNHLITDRVRNNVENARNELRSILAGPTSEGINETAYGLYMAGIEWDQHYRRVKGSDKRARMESYFRRSMFNDNGLRKATLALAQEVAVA